MHGSSEETTTTELTPEQVALDYAKKAGRLQLGFGALALTSLREASDWEQEALRRDTARAEAVLDEIHGVDTAPPEPEGDEMGSQLILGDLTVHQHGPAAGTAAAGGADVEQEGAASSPPATTAPAGTIGRAIGQLVRTALVASVGGLVLGAVVGVVVPKPQPADEAPRTPPQVAGSIEGPESGIPPPEPAVPPAARELYRRISIGP